MASPRKRCPSATPGDVEYILPPFCSYSFVHLFIRHVCPKRRETSALRIYFFMIAIAAVITVALSFFLRLFCFSSSSPFR